VKWTNWFVDAPFSFLRWADKEKGVITFIGDEVQFQNGFGAWIRHNYTCDFDPATKTVTNVQVNEGKLQR
jgi:hypothetical protein